VDSTVLVQSWCSEGPRPVWVHALRHEVNSGQWTVLFRVALPRGFGQLLPCPLARASHLLARGVVNGFCRWILGGFCYVFLVDCGGG
jgi:hypothetical protein